MTTGDYYFNTVGPQFESLPTPLHGHPQGKGAGEAIVVIAPWISKHFFKYHVQVVGFKVFMDPFEDFAPLP